MRGTKCVLYYFGIVFPILAYASIFLAIYNAPWFSWYSNALSDLGVYPASSGIFNSGLIIAGLLYMIFSLSLLVERKTYLWRIGTLLLSFDAVSLMLVGVFPENVKFYHGFFALMYFILFPVSFIFMGLSMIKSNHRTGFLFILSAILGLAIWFIPWRSIGIKGIAIPEFLASLTNTIPIISLSIKRISE